MSKQEARAQRIQIWLEHLRRCEAEGGSVAAYTKEHGLPTSALYQWRSRLVRDGLWPAKIRKAEPDPRSQIVASALCSRRSDGASTVSVHSATC